MQLLHIVLQGVWQPYWYFGTQTILWAVVLVGLILFLAQIAWRNRGDTLVVAYAKLRLCTELLAAAVWSVQPITHIYSPLDRSLLVIILKMQSGNAQLYGTLATMALFLLATNRNIRWLGLVLSALLIGLGRQYLFDYQTGNAAMFALWIYYLCILVPLALVCIAWQLDRSRAAQAWQAT